MRVVRIAALLVVACGVASAPVAALPGKPGLVAAPTAQNSGVRLPRLAQAGPDPRTEHAASPSEVPVLPRNQPADVQGIMAVCTGIDDDSRKDARWQSYPLKLEFAAANGEYLAFAEVSVTDQRGRNVVTVRCPGAWLLLGLQPGMYKAKVTVADQAPQTVAFAVPMNGQKSIVLHFPKPADGGDISPDKSDHS